MAFVSLPPPPPPPPQEKLASYGPETYVHACVLLPVCYIGQQASRGSVQLDKKGVVMGRHKSS